MTAPSMKLIDVYFMFFLISVICDLIYIYFINIYIYIYFIYIYIYIYIYKRINGPNVTFVMNLNIQGKRYETALLRFLIPKFKYLL